MPPEPVEPSDVDGDGVADEEDCEELVHDAGSEDASIGEAEELPAAAEEAPAAAAPRGGRGRGRGRRGGGRSQRGRSRGDAHVDEGGSSEPTSTRQPRYEWVEAESHTFAARVDYEGSLPRLL